MKRRSISTVGILSLVLSLLFAGEAGAQAVTSPNGGEVWVAATTHNITWTGPAVGNVKIELYRGILLSRTITSSTPNDGSYSWTIPAGTTPAANYKVKITSTLDSSVYDYSNAYFTITEPYITVTSPNGGETWALRTTHDITWNSGIGGEVEIELYKGGSLLRTITPKTANDGSYSWLIPSDCPVASDLKIKVSSLTNAEAYDSSNSDFSTVPYVTVVSPNGGERWETGTSHEITWNSIAGGNVKIELYAGASPFTTISASTANDGSFTWDISTSQSFRTDYKVKITSTTDSAAYDYSDAVFAVAGYISVTSPNGGESWEPGTSHNVTWSSNLGGNVKIDLYKAGALQSTIAATTANDGSYSWSISPVITQGNDYRIRVTSLVDGAVYDSSDADFEVALPGFITVTSPNGGEIWYSGTNHEITWNTDFGGNVRIDIYDGTVVYRGPVGQDGAGAGATITASTPNDGSFTWSIPAAQTPRSDYRIQVTSLANALVADHSDADFSIASAITVTSPNGGEAWGRGSIQSVTWTSAIGGSVKIELYKGGAFYTTLAADTANDGNYTWEMSPSVTAGDDYRVRITSLFDDAVYDSSDSDFSIVEPYVTVTSPNGGESWRRSSSYPITWIPNAGGNVKIELYKGGAFHSTVAADTANDGNYTWEVPWNATPGSDYRVRIASLANGTVFDASDADFSISEAFLAVTQPNGATPWHTGDGHEFSVMWDSSSDDSVRIELYKGDALAETLAVSTPNDGSFDWPLPDDFTPGDDYRIKITSTTDSLLYDYSDYFTIWGYVHITSPKQGDDWTVGTTHDITWSTNAVSSTVTIRLRRINGVIVSTIAVDTPDDGSFTWDIPTTLPSGTDYHITVSAYIPHIADAWGEEFTILNPTPFVTSPNGGELWSTGETHMITWNSSGAGTVQIELYKAGALHSTIAEDTSNDGSFTWEISPAVTAGGDYRIRITPLSDAALYDTSDGEFWIFAPGTQGPLVHSVATLPTYIRQGIDPSLTVTATADDSATGSSNIAGAEYFVGADPGQGSGTPMSAADGSFDSPTEALRAYVATSAWTVPDVKTINVRARDAAGNWTSPAAHIDISVLDGEAPSPPTSLTARAAPGFRKITGRKWETLGTVLPEEEERVIDLGAVREVSAIGMKVDPSTRCSPTDFSMEGSLDASEWTPLAEAAGFKPVKGQYLWQCVPAEYRYVRLRAESLRDARDGRYYVRVPEVSVYESLEGNSVNATWVATADDDSDASSGPASIYDLRYSGSPITEANWDAAKQVPNEPIPAASGTNETCTFSVGDLTTVYVALKVGDAALNWSDLATAGPISILPSGFACIAPADLATLGPSDPAPAFGFQLDGTAKACCISFSGCGGFPQQPTVGDDGEIRKTKRFALARGADSWTPSPPLWNAVKTLVHTTGLLYWRLEGKSPSYGTVYGICRTIIFDSGSISNPHVVPSHLRGYEEAVRPSGATPLALPLAGSVEAIWPNKDVTPTFSWTNSTGGIAYFLVDISKKSTIPLSDKESTITLGGSGTPNNNYTPTAAEWKKIRRLATWRKTVVQSDTADGVLYWRVRGLTADRKLSCASAPKTLMIDGGEWTLSPPVDHGDGTWTLPWAHTGEGLGKFSIELSINNQFRPTAKETLKVPAKSFAGTSYTLTTGNIKRLTAFARRNSLTALRYRILAEDAEAQFSFYTADTPLTILMSILTVLTSSLPDVPEFEDYDEQLAARGGTEPYTWTIDSGSLPQGLYLSSSGALSGYPRGNTKGTWDFVVKVTDSESPPETAVKAVSITVRPADLKIYYAGCYLPDAEYGYYSQTAWITGGIGPYTWTVDSGSLPEGLILWPDPDDGGEHCRIIGYPVADPGTYEFTLRVTDSQSPPYTATDASSITVLPADLTILTSGDLPSGYVNLPYLFTLRASGGVPPYTWSLAPGEQLQPGLTLLENGIITGIPSEAWGQDFEVRVTDSQSSPDSANAVLVLRIYSPGVN